MNARDSGSSAAPEKDGSFTNTNRQVQMGRKALPLPGDAKQDLWTINEIAKRLDVKKMVFLFEQVKELLN